MLLTKGRVSNGKTEVVYAKQPLLKPAQNSRHLQQKTKAGVRHAALPAPGQAKRLLHLEPPLAACPCPRAA